MGDPEPSELVWRKSMRSDDSNCVEVATVGAKVLVRHSKHQSGAILTFSRSAWEAFLVDIRRGEFGQDQQSASD